MNIEKSGAYKFSTSLGSSAWKWTMYFSLHWSPKVRKWGCVEKEIWYEIRLRLKKEQRIKQMTPGPQATRKYQDLEMRPSFTYFRLCFQVGPPLERKEKPHFLRESIQEQHLRIQWLWSYSSTLKWLHPWGKKSFLTSFYPRKPAHLAWASISQSCHGKNH